MYLLIIGLGAIAIFYLNQNNNAANKRAIEILDKKFIDGEISEEEYLNKNI
ncbi:hypothetical protein PL321_02765 [Caloramator sp. mosi_1]|uniref:hypothetical protein n=1 Tax=Caloramator sp. mosi_1 TaxID=3023090 RepID=UPI002362E668|nr:hypothetical protein [Caloramator sp. mosi_1]WDC84643.1 hypothetical protein PL321_02765 [Caloramator sp. mosi_1]